MRTLVLCDDYWHPARVVRAGIAPLAEASFEFDWIEHAAEWSAERMRSYPAVLFTKMNHTSASDQSPWIDKAVQAAFLDYVREGNGLLVIHSGSASNAELPIMRRLMGGTFLYHPPQCAVTVEPRPEHPLTSNAEFFTLVDEHYHMALDDEQADVFLTARSEHGTQPGGWTRREGVGRVCLLTPGHNLDVWLQPSYQAVIANALRWCHRA